MEAVIAVVVFLVGLAGGAAWAMIAGGYSVGLSSVVLAMIPSYVVLLLAGVRAARGTLSRRGKQGLVVGVVLIGLVLWIGHDRIAYRRQGDVVREGLVCYGFQCKLGEWLLDARVSREVRRETVASLVATGGPGAQPIKVGNDALQPMAACRYRVDNLVLRCSRHDVPAPLMRGSRAFPPPCPGPVRIPAELAP